MKSEETTTTCAGISEALRAFSDAAVALAIALEATTAEAVASVEAEPTKFLRPVAVVDAPEPPPALEPQDSYATGEPMTGKSLISRHHALKSSERVSCDLRVFAGRVRELRLEVLKASPLQIGTILGVAASTVSNWESGLNFPRRVSRERIIALAAVYTKWTPADWGFSA